MKEELCKLEAQFLEIKDTDGLDTLKTELQKVATTWDNKKGALLSCHRDDEAEEAVGMINL